MRGGDGGNRTRVLKSFAIQFVHVRSRSRGSRRPSRCLSSSGSSCLVQPRSPTGIEASVRCSARVGLNDAELLELLAQRRPSGGLADVEGRGVVVRRHGGSIDQIGSSADCTHRIVLLLSRNLVVPRSGFRPACPSRVELETCDLGNRRRHPAGRADDGPAPSPKAQRRRCGVRESNPPPQGHRLPSSPDE